MPDRAARAVKHACSSRVRTINVEVPEEVYWHVRQCATASHMSMKDYMAKFCQESRPYPPETGECAGKQ